MMALSSKNEYHSVLFESFGLYDEFYSSPFWRYLTSLEEMKVYLSNWLLTLLIIS